MAVEELEAIRQRPFGIGTRRMCREDENLTPTFQRVLFGEKDSKSLVEESNRGRRKLQNSFVPRCNLRL
ncbi:hypothetical protein [Acetomicrobium sp.]|uniref:hypothetical protein n=1 Tax=Acetomicrobium sp. TaxID=1872099 RepID=UPI0028713054|nr:hypothetical protein [Acetomicrobium sp.]MDR9770584.1 hypothetical protein [Acetomicrobium sp.]